MKRYKLTQEYEIMEEDLTIVKDLSVHLLVASRDVKEDRIIKMLNQFAHDFAELMLEENSEIEKDFAELNEKIMNSEKDGKRWFK